MRCSNFVYCNFQIINFIQIYEFIVDDVFFFLIRVLFVIFRWFQNRILFFIFKHFVYFLLWKRHEMFESFNRWRFLLIILYWSNKIVCNVIDVNILIQTNIKANIFLLFISFFYYFLIDWILSSIFLNCRCVRISNFIIRIWFHDFCSNIDTRCYFHVSQFFTIQKFVSILRIFNMSFFSMRFYIDTKKLMWHFVRL